MHSSVKGGFYEEERAFTGRTYELYLLPDFQHAQSPLI